MAGPDLLSATQQATASASFVNYNAAEVQVQERDNLARLRAEPYNPQALTAQFSHGINQHLPDGVATKISADRYTKDPVCQLVMDNIPGVTPKQHEQLVKMLRERAPNCVAYSLDDISGYSGVEPPMEINLTTTQKIITPPRRNWSSAEAEIIDEKCADLLAGRFPTCIELTESDYACNPVLAIKRAPDGTWSDKRFCINFIPINKHTELEQYKTFRADLMLDKVVRAKFLTALDLRSGFHQIPIHPAHVSKAAFWQSTHTQSPRLLAYQRMPFGLKNAPAKFQRVMDVELAGAKCTDFAFAYIDDLIIASNTWEEHMEHVERVLQMLEDCNLKIHPEKSIFATNIVEYLGHNVVGEHGITMNEAKVKAIRTLRIA
jgi:Reverse transcriptase (RNA-dependent DNA polymerase)